MNLRYLLALTTAAWLVSGCGQSDSVTAGVGPFSAQPSARVNTLQVLDPTPDLVIDGHTVTLVCATGYDSLGRQVFGPDDEVYDENMLFPGLPDSTARVDLDFHRAQGATLARQTENVNFLSDDDGVIQVQNPAPVSLGFNQRKTFTVRLVNSSDYPDDKVFLSVLGKDRADTAFYYVKFGANDQNTAERFGPVADYDKYSQQLSLLKKEGDHTYSFQCPYENLVSGRIYLSFGQKLQGLGLNSANPLDLQTPSSTGAPDYLTLFEFMELSATIPKAGEGPQVYTLFANTSVVDFFSMGLGMTLNFQQGGQPTNKVVGFVDGARDKVLAEFENPNTPLEFRTGRAYIQKNNKILRVLSPVKIVDVDPGGALNRYLNSAIDEGWSEYARQVLNIPDNLPSHRYGFTYTGQLITNNILPMTCTNVAGSQTGLNQLSSLPKPTTKIIWFCDDAPPPPGPPENTWRNAGSDAHKRLVSLLSSALNRGVFTNYSDWGNGAKFYSRADKKYNFYSRIMHQFAIDGKVYGFGYDDVYGQDPTLAAPLADVNQVVITIPKVPQI